MSEVLVRYPLRFYVLRSDHIFFKKYLKICIYLFCLYMHKTCAYQKYRHCWCMTKKLLLIHPSFILLVILYTVY